MINVIQDGPWLRVSFDTPQRMLSWSITQPGLRKGNRVLWRQVRDADLSADMDAISWFREELARENALDAVGLLTSADLKAFQDISVTVEDICVRVVLTLGLSNGETVGQRVASLQAAKAGTINMVCHINTPLSEPAMIEAMSIATQARTYALAQAGLRHPLSGEVITGTGTDCIVIVCEWQDDPKTGALYSGMHTAIGEAIGKASLQATKAAIDEWCQENRL